MPDTSPTRRHGGQVLVDQLALNGVTRVFCVPGESFLAVLDGLVGSGIDVVNARHEGGAAMMAEADGKLTGRPGLAIVTRGPGATNASAGVHVAFQDSTPMLLLIGQVARDQRDREAFQEIDYRAMFAPLAKWVAEVDLAERLPEYLSHAFQVAMSGRPGPVVLALPEDVLSGMVETADAAAARPARNEASSEAITEIVARLEAAEQPLVLAGGPGWSAKAAGDLGRFAERAVLPVAVSLRCQDYLDNRHANYAGDVGIGINPALAARVREADILLVLGPRLGEMTTSGYTLLTVPNPAQSLIHVHPDASEIGRVYRADLGIAADAADVVARLADAAIRPRTGWATRVREARADYEALAGPAGDAGRPQARGRHRAPRCRAGGRRDPHQRGPATIRPSRTATTATGAGARSSRRHRARWATAYRPPSPPSCATRPERSCASPATAAFR